MLQLLRIVAVVVVVVVLSNNKGGIVKSETLPFCVYSSKKSTCPGDDSQVEIPYPFWIENRRIVDDTGRDYMGYPGFQIKCAAANGRPVINISSNLYYVLGNDRYTGGGRLRVVDVEIDAQECPQPQTNFSTGSQLFLWESNYNMVIFYNCSRYPPNAMQNIPCLNQNNSSSNNSLSFAFVEQEIESDLFDWYQNCDEYVVIPLRMGRSTVIGNYTQALKDGFYLGYSLPVNCRNCELSGGNCWANETDLPPITTSFHCNCTGDSTGIIENDICPGRYRNLYYYGYDQEWVNEARGRPRRRSRPSKAIVAAISASASVLLLVVITISMVILVHLRKQNFHFNKEAISSISPTRYSYSKLEKVTKNFATKLGEGGFGKVYKGSIHRGGVDVPVAVKVLKVSKQTEKQFMNEVQTVGSVHHHNLLGMLGYCVEQNIHALVYEFMENGSLDQYIYHVGAEDASETVRMKLSSRQVYSIALEIARGLLYLHQGCRSRILHCDIKPPSVLLDSKFSAKVADFGLARMIDKDRSHVSLTRAQGTPGYAAPEMWLKTLGPVTDKSDVYSYGMLILEMVGRRKNYDARVADSSKVYFPEWLYNKVGTDEFPLLMNDGNTSEVTEDEKGHTEDDEMAIRRMSLVGLWCIQYIPSNRPSMDKVVQMLEGHVDIGIPPAPFPHNTTRTNVGTSQDAV